MGSFPCGRGFVEGSSGDSEVFLTDLRGHGFGEELSEGFSWVRTNITLVRSLVLALAIGLFFKNCCHSSSISFVSTAHLAKTNGQNPGWNMQRGS